MAAVRNIKSAAAKLLEKECGIRQIVTKNAKQLYVKNRKTWRGWLEKNHAKTKEIWLIYFKKHTGKQVIPYEEAVEEALCFGWVDSLIKKIDEDKYARKFTPRKNESKWSELNKKRATKMIKQGRMTKMGLAKINAAKKNGRWNKPKSAMKVTLEADLKIRLQKNKKAWVNFKNLAPTYQKHYIGWITIAKRPETREKRIKEAIELLSQNKKLGLK